MNKKTSKKALADKIYSKSRDPKTIEQEYASVASQLGDTMYKSEILKASERNLLMSMAKLQDEHKTALEKTTTKDSNETATAPHA